MDSKEFLEKIAQADMVLVGLGEEFDNKRMLMKCPQYAVGNTIIKESEFQWLLPAWDRFCMQKLSEKDVKLALDKLRGVLQDKNYFVVSVSTNSEIAKVAWKHGHCVMPCGSMIKKQCKAGCEGTLELLTDAEEQSLNKILEKLFSEGVLEVDFDGIGCCPSCGEAFVLNNIYAENYNEKGYLKQWELYRKWLQGTMNRQLLVLELGVGMKFPSVIRWPFEKVAFFNQKAQFYRVNEKLYQLTEELSGKGCGIPQNSIDWLAQL